MSSVILPISKEIFMSASPRSGTDFLLRTSCQTGWSCLTDPGWGRGVEIVAWDWMILCAKFAWGNLCPRWFLQFIKSDFRGQLPKQFSSLPNATAIVPEAMNDANKEEPSRYVSHSTRLNSQLPLQSISCTVYSMSFLYKKTFACCNSQSRPISNSNAQNILQNES